MRSSTRGFLARLGIIVGILAWLQLCTHLVYTIFVAKGEATCAYYYTKSVSCVNPPWYSVWFGSWGATAAMYFIGAIASAILALVLLGMASVIWWLLSGKWLLASNRTDPCQDHANCPCPRHRQEEADARAAEAAAIAAATAAVVTTTLNNN